MSELRVAVVGCGPVAESHLSGWDKVKNSQLVAAVDVNESVAKATAVNWKIPVFYNSLSEALSRQQIDVVDICTPPQIHAKLAIEAMKAGVNVLIEKPMTMTVKDADALLECKKKTGMMVGVIHNWLFDHSVWEARALVEKGIIGKVMNMEVEALAPPSDSMSCSEHHWCHTLPGGRFSEMLVHPLYLMRHFLGNNISLLDMNVSKLGSIPWMKSDELFATFSSGEKMGRVYASFNSSRDAIYLNLYGRNGIIKLDIINQAVTVLPKRITSRFSKGYDSIMQARQLISETLKNSATIASGKWLSGHEKCISLFAESYRNHTEPPVTAEDAYETIKILEQCAHSLTEI